MPTCRLSSKPGIRGNSGQAVAEVLFGDYNPGGKLSTTFPKSVGQIPWAFPFKPNATGKGFARVDGELYPFGYGLSYTTFEISDLQPSATKIADGDTPDRYMQSEKYRFGKRG